MNLRSPKADGLRHARMRAEDARRDTALLGGFRRTGKLVEVRLDDDQAADLIASLSGATGAERIGILSQLARAGIFESTPSDRCGASASSSSSAAPSETAPVGADASPAVAPAGGTLHPEPASTSFAPTPPASLAGSPPAGTVVALSATVPAPSSTRASRKPGASPQEVGVMTASAPNVVDSGTSTPQRCVGPLGSHARHRYEGGRECKRCRAADPRYGVIDRRAAKITAPPASAGAAAPGVVQGEAVRDALAAGASTHPGGVAAELSPGGDGPNEAEAPAPPATVTTAAREVAAGGPPTTSTALAFAEDMEAVQAAISALPEAEVVLTSFADDAAAERIIARILDREAQRKRIATQAEAMDRELAGDIRGLAWRFGNALEEWTRRNLRGSKRSHKTLSGTAGFAKVAGRWSVEDARAVEAWALAQDDPEKFGRWYGFTLEPAAVLAYAKATGEAIPGLKLTAERETFYLKGDVRVDVTKARSAPALPEPSEAADE